MPSPYTTPPTGNRLAMYPKWGGRARDAINAANRALPAWQARSPPKSNIRVAVQSDDGTSTIWRLMMLNRVKPAGQRKAKLLRLFI